MRLLSKTNRSSPMYYIMILVRVIDDVLLVILANRQWPGTEGSKKRITIVDVVSPVFLWVF